MSEMDDPEMMTDEDFLAAMEEMAINEPTDVGELLNAMSDNHMISREEADMIMADITNEPIKSSLPEQTRPTEPDNETNVDRCIQQLLDNDPNLKQINLNNMKRTPIPQIKRLIQAMAYNEHLEKLSLANLGLYDQDVAVLAEAITINQSLKHLNLETNYLSGDYFSKIFEAALENQTIEEIKLVNQGVTFSTQSEKEIISFIQKNHGLCKISINLRLPEGRHKIEQATLRNGEIRRIMRRKAREEEEATKRVKPAIKENELATEPVKPVVPKPKAEPKKIVPVKAPAKQAPMILAAPEDVKKVAKLPRRESLPQALPEPELAVEKMEEKEEVKKSTTPKAEPKKIPVTVPAKKEPTKVVPTPKPVELRRPSQQEDAKKAEIKMVVAKKKPVVANAAPIVPAIAGTVPLKKTVPTRTTANKTEAEKAAPLSTRQRLPSGSTTEKPKPAPIKKTRLNSESSDKARKSPSPAPAAPKPSQKHNLINTAPTRRPRTTSGASITAKKPETNSDTKPTTADSTVPPRRTGVAKKTPTEASKKSPSPNPRPLKKELNGTTTTKSALSARDPNGNLKKTPSPTPGAKRLVKRPAGTKAATSAAPKTTPAAVEAN